MMNVLSIGAGKEQSYSIKTAKDLGYKVVAVDGNENAFSRELVDVFYNIDLKEEDKILEIAKEHKIEYILPAPIGRFLTTIGYINEELKLPGINKKVASLLVDKKRFNEFLGMNKFNLPKQLIVKDLRNNISLIENFINEHKDIVLKPQFGSGSRGVYVLNQYNFKIHCQEHIKELLLNENSLLEECIKGQEFGVDIAIIHGEIKLFTIRKKELTDFPYRQETAIILDNQLFMDYKDIIYPVVNKLIDCLNIDNTFMNLDIIVTAEKIPYIIEASCRPSGIYITEKLIPYYLGFEPIKEFIKEITLNNTSAWNVIPTNSVAIYFWDLPEGRVKEIKKISHFLSEKKLLEMENNLKDGLHIKLAKNGKELLERGYFIVKGMSQKQLNETKNLIMSSIKIEKEVGNNG